MKKIISNVLAVLGLGLVFVAVAANAETISSNANDRYVYVGTEFGISDPIIKSFKHDESKTKIRLKKSHLYGARIGYSFYPNMMIEISGSHQPKYRMAYKLPEKSLSSLVPGLSIPETPGVTKVSANVFTVNFIYEMEKMASFAAIKPYVIFGAGVAKITINPTVSYWKPPAYLGLGLNDIAYFKIKKYNQNCFTWQAGVGFTKSLTDNFNIDFGAKIQVVNDIKIKYQTLNTMTNSFDEAKPIKKTIGSGEFTMGLTYKFPLGRN